MSSNMFDELKELLTPEEERICTMIYAGAIICDVLSHGDKFNEIAGSLVNHDILASTEKD